MDLNQKDVNELEKILENVPEGFGLYSEGKDCYIKVTVVVFKHKYHHSEYECRGKGTTWWISEREFDTLLETNGAVHLDEVFDRLEFLKEK